MQTRITPNTDTFYAVLVSFNRLTRPEILNSKANMILFMQKIAIFKICIWICIWFHIYKGMICWNVKVRCAWRDKVWYKNISFFRRSNAKVPLLSKSKFLRKFYNRPIGFRGCFSGIIFFTRPFDRNFWRLDKNAILLHWSWATQAFFIRRNHVASLLTDKNNLSIQLFQSFNLLPLFTDVWISNCFSYKLREDL